MVRIKNGDLLQVKLENDEIGYAEKIGNNDGEYEVYFISFDEDAAVWRYDKDYSVIPKQSIMKHVPNVKGDYAKAWLKLGFFQETDKDDQITFIKMSEDLNDLCSDDGVSVESVDHSSEGTEDLDSLDTYSESDSESDSNDRSFIDDTPLHWNKDTQGNNNCNCETCSTIKANNAIFNTWQPSDPMGIYIKNVISKIEQKAILENDNINFSSDANI